MYVCKYACACLCMFAHVCVRDCAIKPVQPGALQPALHATSILDLYTQSLTPTGRGYEQISSGTCASRGLVTITDKVECFKASKALGRTVSRTGTTHKNDPPWGCYYEPASGHALVNINADNKANRKATVQYQSVCAGGTNV